MEFFENLVSQIPNDKERKRLEEFIHSPRFIISAEVTEFSIRHELDYTAMAGMLRLSTEEYSEVLKASNKIPPEEYLRIKKCLDIREDEMYDIVD